MYLLQICEPPFLLLPHIQTSNLIAASCISMNIQDIQLTLDHFEEPIFPRIISTKATHGKQIPVNNIEEAYRMFEEAIFLDLGLMHILLMQTTKA